MMRRIISCWILTFLIASPAIAQRNSTTLSEFSKTRTIHFNQQRLKASAFSSSHHVPLFFTDAKGTHVLITGVNQQGNPIYRTTLNAEAAITTGTVQLQNGSLGLNILGNGMLVGVWDGGIVKDHIELGQRVISKQGPAVDNVAEDTHATHVTGTLIATGINPAAKGMAPLAEATTWYFDNDEVEMAALAKPDQTSLLVSNHSYGTATGWFKNNGAWIWTGDAAISPVEDYRFGFYGDRAQTLDQLATLAPYYTIVWAAGNDRADVGDGSKPVDGNGGTGYDCIIPESVAKNIITVGAVDEVLTYSGPFSVDMSFFSSWGPTDDGRIKPDLVGDGVNVFSLSASGVNTYTNLTGTSMATPNVAGSLLLLQELYSKLHGGGYMKSATLKALAIHTAKEAGNSPGPDYSFGWGLLDVASAARLLLAQDDQNVSVSQLTLRDGQPYSLALNPQANQKITATIAWSDPAGTPVAESLDPVNLMLVNDLDLRIVDDAGREQLPWILDPSNPSLQAATGDNFRDNVEKLEFNSPEGKAYTLRVTNKGTLVGGHQDFSLIISYQSTTPTTTYYWVGGSGAWTDGAHWALTSGGAPAFIVPSSGDRAMADENSFDSVGVDVISLPQNVSCSSLVWMSDKPAGIAFNGHVLSVSQQLVMSSSSFSTQTPGTIHLASGNTTGSFQANQINLSGVTLAVDGTWDVNGNITADELQVNSGTVNILNSQLSLDRWTTNTSVAKQISLNNSTLWLSQSSSLDGASLTISSVNSSLRFASTAVLQWLSVGFPGEMIIDSAANLTIHGDNHIGKISVDGTLLLTGANQVDTLLAVGGATINLTPATTQTILEAQLQGSSGHPITVSSTAICTLNFTGHTRFCFDYLHVTNVSIAGDAIVSAGVNSTLVNSSHWRQQLCSDVLFADFNVRYPCAGGITEFMNTGSGQGAHLTWKVGNVVLADSSYSFTAPGDYSVTLIATDPSGSDSVTRIIQILPNTLSANQVVVSGQMMTSFKQAERYQWYENEAKIQGGTQRSYPYSTVGVYFVVTFDEQCNLVSSPFTITGVIKDESALDVYPNPAGDFIQVTSRGAALGKISLIDLLGREVLHQSANQPTATVSTAGISDGVYVLEVSSTELAVRRRIVIRH